MVESTIPQPVAEILTALLSELLGIRERLTIYRELYTGSPEQKAALRRTAHTFFTIIHDVLLDDIFLAISRLIDPQHTQGKDNLSLEQLQWQISQGGESTLAATIDGDIINIKQECKPFQQWRHKYLAHRDLATATSAIRGILPLPSIEINQIETALRQIHSVLNRVETHFGKLPTDYEIIPFNIDSDALIDILVRFWRQHDDETQEFLKKHSISGIK